MNRLMLLAVVSALVPANLVVSATMLEQIVLREDPKFDCANAVLTVGCDGNVYLASNANPGYVLRVSRDGAQKLGGDVIYALSNAVANTAGVIATANAHFNHSVNFYNRDFEHFGACNEFLVNDTVQWDAPAHVEAGPSGDFYGIDQHRLRILRLNPSGKIVQVYVVPAEAKAWEFRVCEATESFYLRGRDGTLRRVGFDGNVRWTQPLPGMPVWTADDSGTLYAMATLGATVQRWTVTGVALPDIALQAGDLAPTELSPATALGVAGGDLILKRAHRTELFQVYDLGSGERKTVVHADHETLRAEFPGLVWTAGRSLPFRIDFSGPAAPQWRVWAATLGDTNWRALNWRDSQLDVPADFAGLYQIKVAPTLNPEALGEYCLREVVEVRVPESRGTISVWTPLNRVWWGHGEEIPANVAVRTSATELPGAAALSLCASGAAENPAALWSTSLRFERDEEAQAWRAATIVPASLVAQLAPGRYVLRATLPGYTCSPQPLRLGPGMASASPYRVTLHGDYTNFNSTADVWDFADVADAMLARSVTLGASQYINRTFAGRYPLSFTNKGAGSGLLQALAKRLAADPAGVSVHKVDFGFPHGHVLGAYGAHGIREWLLLVGMDAALPIGTSTSYSAGLNPEQYAAEIQSYSDVLKTLPGFCGWDWVANWWVTDPNLRFASPEEQAAFEAAQKVADDTGAWDSVLDNVGDRTINWQPDAQQIFREALDKSAPQSSCASAGPYRRPEVYPPISFANVDEVDLHYQAEQISCPNWTAHATDYYKRPGKPAWIHPELWNDSGTGEQILPATWLAMMRGVDGIGTSGNIPNWGVLPTDARSGYPGTTSVFRAINQFARRYGPWLRTLENNDRVAILVSSRQVKMDRWGGIGGRYFTRLWEAFLTCLYARRPATFLFAEDKPDLGRYQALLFVGQRYEPEPALANLLAQARQTGVRIYGDGTCRESLLESCTPLGVTFDRIEKLNGFNNDVAYWDFTQVLLAQAVELAQALDTTVSVVGDCDEPEVLLSESRSGDGRFIWVVNNTFTNLDAGMLWRVQNAVATHTPVVAHVKLPIAADEVVYDMFDGTEVGPEFDADLRYSCARLYAVLPCSLKGVSLKTADKLTPGQKVDWTALVSGSGQRSLPVSLPLRVRMLDGDGSVLEERYTTTAGGSFFIPLNAVTPVSLAATELITGLATGQSAPRKEDRTRITDLFGPRIRDIAVSQDGQTALLNAFDWGQNLYTVDLATGNLRTAGAVGGHFAYAPQTAGDGFAVQGYDLESAEGYHLYQLNSDGLPQRRFALPGLPARLTNWAFASHLVDQQCHFANAADGTWFAASGNLGLAVWAADGTLLWSRDWSQSSREARQVLALNNAILVTARGMTLTAQEARTGRVLWEIELASTGSIEGLAASLDGATVAARANTQSGRVYAVRHGAVVGSMPTAATELIVHPGGAQLGLTSGRALKWYTATGELMWVFQSADTLRGPRVSSDGTQLAVGSELGLLHEVQLDTGVVRTLDLGSLPVVAWLPDGELLVATWMGRLCRLDEKLNNRWCVNLRSSQVVPRSKVPTSRMISWSTAEPEPLPLTPNLIDPEAVLVEAMLGDQASPFTQPGAGLFDGVLTPPAAAWLSWEDIGMIDSGWKGSFSLVVDTFRTQLRVTAITFVEDPAHPESWLRDARLEYWDAVQEKWIFAQYLTSDAAVHTHKLMKPIQAAKFRLARPDSAGWPASNLRLAEIVFHGESLGASHPDVVAEKPVAVLFDEQENDLRTMAQPSAGGSFQRGGAASGGTCIRVEANKFVNPSWQQPFGHAVPNWDFQIVENPKKPGEFRWLEFSCKALAAETRGMSVRIGAEWPSGAVIADVGEAFPLTEGFWLRKQMADRPPAEWAVVRLDLWAALASGKNRGQQPFKIRCIGFGAVGGPAAFDRVLLGRSEFDLGQ